MLQPLVISKRQRTSHEQLVHAKWPAATQICGAKQKLSKHTILALPRSPLIASFPQRSSFQHVISCAASTSDMITLAILHSLAQDPSPIPCPGYEATIVNY
jgi:hypothetical protein